MPGLWPAFLQAAFQPEYGGLKPGGPWHRARRETAEGRGDSAPEKALLHCVGAPCSLITCVTPELLEVESLLNYLEETQG